MTPHQIADALDDAPRYGDAESTDNAETAVFISHELACALADALRGIETPEVLH